MASSDIEAYVKALHESLLDTAVQQLRAALPKLEGIDAASPDAQKQLKAALPRTASSEVRNFLNVLANEGVLDRLPDIIHALEEAGSGGAAIVSAEVTSAVPLTDKQQKSITDDLNKRYKTDLDVQFGVDESLIGGLIIRVGDQVLDNSLRTRLASIQRNMLVS